MTCFIRRPIISTGMVAGGARDDEGESVSSLNWFFFFFFFYSCLVFLIIFFFSARSRACGEAVAGRSSAPQCGRPRRAARCSKKPILVVRERAMSAFLLCPFFVGTPYI
jgi:hypothetical protein